MTARTAICACLAVALLTTATASAHAARFEGHAVDDQRVSISFDRERGKVRNFTIRRARFYCDDGRRFRARTRTGAMRVRENARFKGQFTSDDGGVLTDVAGRIARKRARGAFRIVTVFPEDRVKCGTRSVSWYARRS